MSNAAKTAKRILITGCSSGIGRATALRLARNGFVVCASARKRETLGELENAGCTTLSIDVNDEASMRAGVAAAGPIDVLVNNAGFSQSGAIEAVPMSRVRAQFETNVFGLVRMCQLVLPGMRARGFGRLINLSSMGGRLVFPGGGFYHATKYAVEAISDALRFEVAAFGVDVVLIEPGLIKSGFSDAAVSAMQDMQAADVYASFHAAVATSTRESYEKGALARLAGVPDDVAAVIEKAITSRRPKPRYTVTASAKLLLAIKKLRSDRGWDRFLRGSFPQPHLALEQPPE
jgi:NADP-dependent 3-hydroxy acid dehydrogenase YdfG